MKIMSQLLHLFIQDFQLTLTQAGNVLILIPKLIHRVNSTNMVWFCPKTFPHALGNHLELIAINVSQNRSGAKFESRHTSHHHDAPKMVGASVGMTPNRGSLILINYINLNLGRNKLVERIWSWMRIHWGGTNQSDKG